MREKSEIERQQCFDINQMKIILIYNIFIKLYNRKFHASFKNNLYTSKYSYIYIIW